jgi:hypothetical protein
MTIDQLHNPKGQFHSTIGAEDIVERT